MRIIIFLSLICCYSCSTKQIAYNEFYYPNGKIQTRIPKPNDNGQINGFSMHYYQNGVLKDSIPLKNAKANGKGYFFDEEGSLTQVMSFRNDSLNGESREYYKNGREKIKAYFIDDNYFGDYYEYHKNGILQFYNCYNYNGENRRVKEYDSLGKLIKNEGKVLAQLKYNKLEFKSGENDSLQLEIVISEAPNEAVDVWSETVGTNAHLTKHYNIQNNRIVHNEINKNIGKHEIIFIGSSRDTSTKIEIRDSIKFIYEVK